MRQDGQRSRGSSSDGVEGALRGRQVSSPLDSCLWPSLSAPALGRGGSGEGGAPNCEPRALRTWNARARTGSGRPSLSPLPSPSIFQLCCGPLRPH